MSLIFTNYVVMMFIRLIVLLLVVGEASAQTQARITYLHESYGGFEQEAVLQIKESIYWYSRHQDKSTTTNDEGMEFYHYQDYIDWFKDLKNNEVCETRLDDGYPTLRGYHDFTMEWEIKDEYDEILGYRVQKAVRKSLELDDVVPFGDVTAWFAIDLPFSAGPERYHGLPGLILRLEYGTKRGGRFTAKEISFEDVSPITIDCNGIEVSSNELINTYLIDKKWLKQERKKLKDKKGQD